MDQNFRFYVREGTFGSINSGNDINIPSDVRIFTAADSGSIYLTDSITLLAGSQSQFFSARNLSTGSNGNTAAKMFSRHNYTSYTDSRFGSLLITNDFGIVGGRDEEDDESYRYRIYTKIRANGGANEAALRFELLKVPGIQDVVFDRHAGSFTVYVFAITPLAAASLLRDVQDRLNEKVAFPIAGLAVNPDLVGISLTTTLRVIGTASAVDKEIIVAGAKAAAEDYVNNLGVGQPLIINEIANRIRNADSRILDIGEPNRQLPEIIIWRERADSSRYNLQRKTYTDYALKQTSQTVT